MDYAVSLLQNRVEVAEQLLEAVHLLKEADIQHHLDQVDNMEHKLSSFLHIILEILVLQEVENEAGEVLVLLYPLLVDGTDPQQQGIGFDLVPNLEVGRDILLDERRHIDP